MPRLTNQQYITQHHDLQNMWNHAQRVFAELPPTYQWEVHDFFQPSKDLTDEELIAHRQQITAKRPSLPAKAGKHYRFLFDTYENARVLAAQPKVVSKVHWNNKRSAERVIRVRSIVRPEVDLKRLARAFLEMAKSMAEAEEKTDKKKAA